MVTGYNKSETGQLREEEINCTVLDNSQSELPSGERGKAILILKLHRQFAQPPMIRPKALMEDAGVWKDEYQEELDSIHSTCQICKLYANTPARPVVSMTLANRFNEKL